MELISKNTKESMYSENKSNKSHQRDQLQPQIFLTHQLIFVRIDYNQI